MSRTTRLFAGLLTVALMLSVVAVCAEPVAPAIESDAPKGQSANPIHALTAPTTKTITGSVFDPEGKPVAGAQVFADYGGRGTGPTPKKGAATTNDEGWFRLEELRPDGKWFVSVDDPRYAKEWRHERSVTIPAAVSSLPLHIQLDSPQSLDGTVVNEHGKPVEGVRVTVITEWLGDSELPLQPHLFNRIQETATDAGGAFSLERLRPGRAGLLLYHPDHAVTRTQPLSVGQAHQLTIEEGFTVEGTVMANGEPLPNTTLCVIASERILNRCRVARTDENGIFHIKHLNRERLESGPEDFILKTWIYSDQSEWASAGYAVYLDNEGRPPAVQIEALPKRVMEEWNERPVIEVRP